MGGTMCLRKGGGGWDHQHGGWAGASIRRLEGL